MRFSHGADMYPFFDPDIHKQRWKYACTLDGTDRCQDIFSIIIKQNESVALGTRVNHIYSTTSPNQTAIYVNVYTSTKEKQTYVDEDGCVLIGKTELDIPFPSEEKRSVSVEYIFGNTEISMTATEDLYGTKYEATYELI